MDANPFPLKIALSVHSHLLRHLPRSSGVWYYEYTGESLAGKAPAMQCFMRQRKKRETPSQKHAYALTAYFRWGKCVCFFFCFSVTREASCLVSLRRMARVCLGRRSRGVYFLPL